MIFVLTSDDYRYVFTDVPPVLCTPSDASIVYFSVIFPINVILMVGVVMLIILIWRIGKVSG